MNLAISDFFKKIETAFDKKQAFVIYRKPNKSELNALFLLNNDLISKVNSKESGFIFAPFDDRKSSFFFSDFKF
jgi:isochorismate synthase